MLRLLRRTGKALSSQIIAILALCIAVSGGTAFAVAAHNSVVSSSIKNGQVKAHDLGKHAVKRAKIAGNAVTGAKVADGSLTGADIKESSLGTVPSAVSAQLGGLAWMSPRGACTPPSTTAFVKCTEMTFTMPTDGQLVLIGQLGIQHRSDNDYQATGLCRYEVNGTAGVSSYIARNAGTLAGGWPQLMPMLGSAQVSAGPVTVGIWCEDSYYSKFTDVAFVAQATTTQR